MAYLKTILVKIIIGLTALQAINLSIDFDYLAGSAYTYAGFDDTDSITEYLIEKIAGNNYIIDNDDDSGAPEKGTEKATDDNQWYFEHTAYAQPHFALTGNAGYTGIQLANKPCRGHFYIEAPPPDAAFVAHGSHA